MIRYRIHSGFDFDQPISEPLQVDWFPREALAFQPPSPMTVSEWAESARLLQAGVSRQPGPWSNAMTPYLVGPMDAFNDASIRHIVLCFGTQIGKTECLYNILGYIIDQDPYSTLMVYPREDDSKTVSRTRIQPMVNDCPSLRARKPMRQDLYQLLEMHFPGMILYMVGANSPAALAQKPCRFILRDEIDKYPERVGKDADPLSLSEERAKSFWDIRKIVDVSSPTLDTCGIWKQLESCEMVCMFFVPCPHCEEPQKLSFQQIKWESGEDESWEWKIQRARSTTDYYCEHCGRSIAPDHKLWMLQRGKWIDGAIVDGKWTQKEPENEPQKVGFHLSSLYSPWLTWADIAEKHLQALKDKGERQSNEPLQNFVNGWLAEAWHETVAAVAAHDIYKAKSDLPPHIVPAEAVALTCFVDVQKYGRWFAVRAWARDFTSWLIHYGMLATWEDIEELLFDRAYQIDGSNEVMKIWRAGVDTGGGDQDTGVSMTEETYGWLMRNATGRGCRVWACKGSSSRLSGKIHVGQPLAKTPAGRVIPGGIQIIQIDTEKLKEAFHYRLQQAQEGLPGGAYVHAETEKVYVKHITAEEKRLDRKGVLSWVRIRKDNHLLDCEIGNFALADPEWPGGGVNTLMPSRATGIPPSRPTGAPTIQAPQMNPQQIPRSLTINPWAGRRLHG